MGVPPNARYCGTPKPSSRWRGILAFGLTFAIAVNAVAQWTVVRLNPTGSASSAAYGVGQGRQVGSVHMTMNRAAIWAGTAQTFVDLHPDSASESVARATANGQQVGHAFLSGNAHASLWTGTAASWVDLNPGGASESYAYGVSEGVQVGEARFGNQSFAGLWRGSAGTWQGLNPAGSTSSTAYAVSGSVQVGYATVDGAQRASLWSGTAGSWVNLNPSGADLSYAYATSEIRQAGMARVAGKVRAGTWEGTSESWTDLSRPEWSSSHAYGLWGITAVGDAVVGGRSRASLWNGTAESWVDLQSFLPAIFTESIAWAVFQDNDFLYVAGWGQNGDGGEALLWVLPHESVEVRPSSFTVTAGSAFSGDLASLFTSDDNSLCIFPNELALIGQVRFDATSTIQTPTSMTFTFEGSVARPGLSQSLHLKNFTTGWMIGVDGRIAPTADTTIEVTLTSSAADFVGQNGALLAYVTWGPINDEDPAQDGWLHCVDLVHWTVER